MIFRQGFSDKRRNLIRLIYQFSLLFVSIVYFGINASAQEPLYRNFTIESGLLSSECYQVLQDKQGYIWIASDRGVSCYNGYKFKSYTKAQGLPESCVLRMYEDRYGRIWFVCLSGKMALFEKGKIRSLPINNELEQHLKRGTINSISMYKDTLRLGYFENNVCLKISYKQGKFKLFVDRNYPKTGPYIHVLPNNECSYGWKQIYSPDYSSSRLMIYNNGRNIPAKIDLEMNLSHWLNVTSIRKILYIIQENGITICSQKNWQSQKKKFDSRVFVLKAFNTASEHEYWVGTMNGLLRFSNPYLSGTPSVFLKGKSITNLIRDREGGMWISTLNAGVFYVKNPSINNVFSKKKIYSFLQQRERLVLGMENSSLWIFGKNQSTYYQINGGKLGYPISRIFPIDNDKIFVRSEELSKFSLNQMKVFGSQRPYYANGLIYDPKKNVALIVVSGSILEWTPKGENVLWKKDKFIQLTSIAKKKEGEFYLGTTAGLFEFGLKEREMKAVKGFKNQLLCLAIKNNTLWMGSKEDGIQVKRGSRHYQIRKQNGLSSDFCRHIYLENEKTAWISTNFGATKIEVLSWSPFRYKAIVINKKNGLISNDIIQVDEWDNKLVIASSKGLSFLPKNHLVQQNYKPTVAISKISVNGKNQPLYSEYRSTQGEGNVDIDYTGICFRQEGELLYRYRLVGLDNTWETTTNTNVTYKNLPFGKTVFEVQAQSTSGKWDSPVKRVSFFFPIPFYETWWFKAVIALLTVSMVVWFISWRIRKVKRRAHDREVLFQKASEMELKFLTAQMNPHFTFNAMNSIQHFMLDNDLLEAQRYLSKYSKLIRRVLENNMEEYIALADDIEMLRLYVEIESLRFSKPILLSVECEQALLESCEIPPMLVQPYIENAIWHGLFDESISDRKIELSFQLEGNELCCTIVDNGIGRKKASIKQQQAGKQQSLGMVITNKRLDHFRDAQKNHSFKITDLYDTAGLPAGTKVVVFIPYILNKKEEIN